MDKVEFGTEEELRARHSSEQQRWFDPYQSKSRDDWGMIGDAVEHPEHGRCISHYIGAGHGVLISEDGRYVDADRADDNYSRAENGAWISEHLFSDAVRRHHCEKIGEPESWPPPSLADTIKK